MSVSAGSWDGVSTLVMENDVLTVDTTMANGRKIHDAWSCHRIKSTTPMK